MNADSSRSHFVASFELQDPSISEAIMRLSTGRLRARRQDQGDGGTLNEAKRINSSLSALGT